MLVASPRNNNTDNATRYRNSLQPVFCFYQTVCLIKFSTTGESVNGPLPFLYDECHMRLPLLLLALGAVGTHVAQSRHLQRAEEVDADRQCKLTEGSTSAWGFEPVFASLPK